MYSIQLSYGCIWCETIRTNIRNGSRECQAGVKWAKDACETGCVARLARVLARVVAGARAGDQLGAGDLNLDGAPLAVAWT